MRARFVALVSSFSIHLGDTAAAEAERVARERLRTTADRVVAIRAGNSETGLRRYGFAYPLVPGYLRSCFVSDAELFAAIDKIRQAPTARKCVAVLGANRPWRDALREHRARGIVSACLTGVCFVLSLLLLGHLAALVLRLLARWRPALRRWNVDTLTPGSFDELLTLCNPYNFQHVKVVGYNNGVVHFGHRYPGKTVVSTVRCNRVVRAGVDVLKADCGATIRKATDFLAADDRELFVVPNYSYVSLGTAFFVPIHGSASDASTVAETIVRVLLYDPADDRFILASSDEPAFRDRVYDLASNVLVLRLWLRVKPKARYFLQQEDALNPGSAELLSALRDVRATNVEIRKASAASATVRIARYYHAAGTGTLEMPRDVLGRLWDRLEENAITSYLMHLLTRRLAWHVELFFTAEEFALFWQTHTSAPLKKIQLRYIRRDGWQHSPFRDHDCISADLFLFRWQRAKFEAYLKQTFGVVRSNPGKHSN